MVYVVLSGEYDKWRIEGVFDSEEKAQECTKSVHDWRETKIAVYGLND